MHFIKHENVKNGIKVKFLCTPHVNMLTWFLLPEKKNTIKIYFAVKTTDYVLNSHFSHDFHFFLYELIPNYMAYKKNLIQFPQHQILCRRHHRS